jgi:hypothetical protein
MRAWSFLVKLIGTHPALGKIKTKTKIDWVSAFKNLALIEFLFFPFFFFFFFFFPEMPSSCRGGCLFCFVIVGCHRYYIFYFSI